MDDWLSDLKVKTAQTASILLVAALMLVLGCDSSSVAPSAAANAGAERVDGSPKAGDFSAPRRDDPTATSAIDGSTFYDDRYGTIARATDAVDLSTSDSNVELGRPGDADEIPGTFDEELKGPVSEDASLDRPR
jgi:hypothetical protein